MSARDASERLRLSEWACVPAVSFACRIGVQRTQHLNADKSPRDNASHSTRRTLNHARQNPRHAETQKQRTHPAQNSLQACV